MPHRMAQLHSKSTANRSKPSGSYLAPNCNSVVGLEGKNYNKVTSKHPELKSSKFHEKIRQIKNFSCSNEVLV